MTVALHPDVPKTEVEEVEVEDGARNYSRNDTCYLSKSSAKVSCSIDFLFGVMINWRKSSLLTYTRKMHTKKL